MSLKKNIRDLLIFLFGCFSFCGFSAEPMDGVSIVPKITGIVGRILECTSMSGPGVTWIFVESMDDKSLRITRQTMDYNAKIRSWKTNVIIPLDKTTILDSIKGDKYEVVFSSPVMNFQFTLTRTLVDNFWRANLKLNKEIFHDIEGKEFSCRPVSQLQSWSEDRIKKIKMDGN